MSIAMPMLGWVLVLLGSLATAATPTQQAAIMEEVTRPAIGDGRNRISGPVQVLEDSRLRIEVYARGGAPSRWIANYIEDFWTTASHADIWIVECGINDVNWFATNPTVMEQELTRSLARVRDYATSGTAHVRVFVQELQPIYLDPTDQPQSLEVRRKAHALAGQILQREARKSGFGWVPVSAALMPGVHAGADAWLDNLATCGRLDGVHPRARGAEVIATQYAAALRDPLAVANALGRPLRVCLFGDSVLIGMHLTEAERIGSRLFELLLKPPTTNAEPAGAAKP